jgi:two-component system KDP operon response regulator KdpE
VTRVRPLVLIVDDDPAIRRALAHELESAGYEVEQAEDGAAALDAVDRREPDLVLTDLAMPRLDGFGFISRLRRTRATPVLVLSVRGEEQDKVRALDLGADDFVAKPFSAAELAARVRAHLRRAGASPRRGVRRFGALEIDSDRRRVVESGREIRLTPTELALLELLAARAGRPVSIRQMVAEVWRGAPATTADTVRVHVGALRRKLEPDPSKPRYIATEPWVGYRFLPEPDGARDPRTAL